MKLTIKANWSALKLNAQNSLGDTVHMEASNESDVSDELCLEFAANEIPDVLRAIKDIVVAERDTYPTAKSGQKMRREDMETDPAKRKTGNLPAKA